MNRQRVLSCVLVCFALGGAIGVRGAEPELPREARVLDPDALLYANPYPTISPDGKWLAYVSRGYVCVCSVETPEPKKLMGVPNSFTWPRFEAVKKGKAVTGSFGELARGTEHDEYGKLHAQLTNTIVGLNWQRSSDGFVFGIESWDEQTRTTSGNGYLATVEGKVTQLSRIEPNSPTRGLIVGNFTEDRRLLIGTSILSTGSHRWGPLIWDIERNRPRATPYLYLVPSTTSGRWIGIEKDTRQLVLLDEELQVTQRFDERLPERTFGFRLHWSPDERFVLWRNQIGFDHYSNWEGFRLDLKTLAKRPLEGRFMREQLAFTGNGGEFVRYGQDGMRSKHWAADIITDAHLTIVPEGFGPSRNVWRMELGVGQRLGEWTPALHMNRGAKLFVIALPQFADHRNLYRWHLMDRTGKAWRFPGGKSDANSVVVPYDVAGFALEDEVIVCYDAKRIFAVPVASILAEENVVRSE